LAGTVTFIEAGGTGAKAVDGSTNTGWVSSSSVAENTDIFLWGAKSLSEKVSGTNQYGYGLGAGIVGEPWDFSSGGGDNGNHIFAIINVASQPNTLAAGGMGIVVADDLATDSVGVWYVGPQAGSLGGWEYFVINPSKAFNAVLAAGSGSWTTGGNPAQLSGVDGIGVYWDSTTSIMGASDNCFLQSISVGTGYRITGTSSVTFADFTTYEQTNRFGAMTTRNNILFPICRFRIGAASGATDTTFSDSGFTVIWRSMVDSANNPLVADGFYGLFADEDTGTTDITLNSGVLAAGSPNTFDLQLSGVTNVDVTNLSVDRARVVTLDAAVTWDGGTVKNSGQIDASGAVFTNVDVLTSTVDAGVAALLWNNAVDPDGKLDGCAFSKGTNAHHAIELGASSPTTVYLQGLSFSGFNTNHGQNDSVLLLADKGSDQAWTINAIGCSGTVSYKKARSTDTVTVNEGVALTVHVENVDTGSPVVGARAWVRVTSTAGGKPYNASVGIERTGSTATVSHTGHGLATDDWVWIQGCAELEYNGTHQITWVDANSYSYTVSGTPSTPASGSPTSTFVVLNDTTDGSGNTGATYTWGANQPVVGRVRSASGSGPFYKTSPISGTIDSSAGLAFTVLMIPDE